MVRFFIIQLFKSSTFGAISWAVLCFYKWCSEEEEKFIVPPRAKKIKVLYFWQQLKLYCLFLIFEIVFPQVRKLGICLSCINKHTMSVWNVKQVKQNDKVSIIFFVRRTTEAKGCYFLVGFLQVSNLFIKHFWEVPNKSRSTLVQVSRNILTRL